MINYANDGISIVTGNPVSNVLAATGIAGPVYDVAHLSAVAITPVLNDKNNYPYVSRLVPEASVSMIANHAFIEYYGSQSEGWNKAAVICTTDVYGVSLSDKFIEESKTYGVTIAAFQQVLPDQTIFTQELQEVQNSGARIILFLGFETHFRPLIEQAEEFELIGDKYVWIVAEGVVATSVYIDTSTGNVDFETARRMQGEIGTVGDQAQSGPPWDRFVAHWQSIDPSIVPNAGPGTLPDVFSTWFYDLGYLIGLSVNEAQKRGYLDENQSGYPTASQWNEIILESDFFGASGNVSFTDIGNRTPVLAIRNFISEELNWQKIGTWDPDNNFIPESDVDVIWFDNTTNIPDLDVREPYYYWSCHDGKKKLDPNGKSVTLHTPDSSDVDEIDLDYECDTFIDCKNLSDENNDCSSNYTLIFIIFGILTGILIFILFIFLIFTIVFGFIFERIRVRACSPTFLLIIITSGFFGYVSVFAWFGKAHPVACAFQPWLLGLGAVGMISALCAKTFRVWRIFALPFKKMEIRDWELLIFWFIMIIPAFIILLIWTIVSTPTADIKEIQNDDHYVCTTGGFTGEPGGIVFFFIIVSYEAFLLLFAIFLTIVTRNVPSMFNESKLLAISIYNLCFLSVVVIPVYFVVISINPFAAWIIRTCAILYAFTATLWLQFIPRMIGVIIIDRCKKVRLTKMISEKDRVKSSSSNSKNESLDVSHS